MDIAPDIEPSPPQFFRARRASAGPDSSGRPVRRDGEWAERGEVTLTEAARLLDLSPMTVLRQLRSSVIPTEQYCTGAPWVIKR